MNRIRRQNRLMIMGAIILVGALSVYTLGFEIYTRNAKVEEILDEDIELVTLTLDNTTLYMTGVKDSPVSYSLTRSRNIEWKMYGKELRISARGGILDLKLPQELDSITIDNTGSETNLYSFDAGNIEIATDSKLIMTDIEADRARLDTESLDITSSEMDTLLVTASGKVDMTETDTEEMKLFFRNLDASVLGGNIGKVQAVSEEGCLEIEPENGISSISVTGGASTIFIKGEDISSQSYQDASDSDGAQIEFTSPKGSVKTC